MAFIKFPCAVAVCLCTLLSAATVTAQTSIRQTSVAATTAGGPRLETDPVIISTANVPAAALPSSANAGAAQLNQLLMAAIDTRVGSPYVYGSSGPYSFDCSGFVWSVFQSAGIRFDRGSARYLWARFAPATAQEEVQFGTLVFFNGLSHIGIVVDGNGFYHSSRSYGVIYSPFSKYWSSRVDGFRRVPLPVQFQKQTKETVGAE
jgi:peptidoglycan endopeptidase LytE